MHPKLQPASEKQLEAGPLDEPWNVSDLMDDGRLGIVGRVDKIVVGANRNLKSVDANYIVACSPPALRALLAERDELAKDAARYDALKHAPTELIRGLLTAAPGHWDGIADTILTNKD